MCRPAFEYENSFRIFLSQSLYCMRSKACKHYIDVTIGRQFIRSNYIEPMVKKTILGILTSKLFVATLYDLLRYNTLYFLTRHTIFLYFKCRVACDKPVQITFFI